MRHGKSGEITLHSNLKFELRWAGARGSVLALLFSGIIIDDYIEGRRRKGRSSMAA